MPDPIAEPLHLPERREYGTKRRRDLGRQRWANVRRRLVRTDYWWIVSSRKDGNAHVVAVLGLWIDDRLFWSMSPRTVTARNLLERDRAIGHIPDPRHVAIVEGRAAMIARADSRVAEAYRRRFGLTFDPSDREMRCYVLVPTVARTWRSDDVRRTAVRWRFHGGERT